MPAIRQSRAPGIQSPKSASKTGAKPPASTVSLAMGRRRPWILTGQLGLMLSLSALALIPDPTQNLTALMAMGFAVNCFAALQDVATDGMAIDVLPVEEQARANGAMWGSKMIGIAAAAAGSAWILTRYGLTAAALASAGVVALISLVPLSVRERKGERLLPWSRGEASPTTKAMQVNCVWTIARDLWRASILPMSLLVGMAAFAFNMATGLFEAVMPVLSTQELSWNATGFSNVKGLGSLVGGIFGMLIGGYLIDRFGRLRVMRVLLVMFILLHAAMSGLGRYWGEGGLVTAYVMAHEFLNTLVTIGVFALAMELCWKRVAATQFTLYMTIANLGLSCGAAMLGPMKSMGGYGLVLAGVAASAALMLLLLRFADLTRHGQRIGEMEDEVAIPRDVKAIGAPAVG